MTWVQVGSAVSGGAVTTSPYASAAEVASLRAMILDLTSIILAADGTQSAPSHSFSSETGTGLYRAAAGDLRISLLGTDRLRVGPTASAPAFTFTSPQADDGVQPDFLFNTTAARIDGHLFEVRSAGSSVLRLGWAGELRFAGSTPEIQVVTPDSALQIFTNRAAASAGTDLIISTSANRSAGLMIDVQNNSVSKLAVQPTGDLQLRGNPLAMWQRAVTTADTTNSTNPGATDVSGLSFSCASGKKYLVRATLFTYAAATTTGLGVSAKATGAPTTSSQFFHQVHWLDTGNDATLTASAFTDSPTTFGATLRTTASSPQVDRFDGYFVTTGTGTFQLRLITELDGSAVTVKAGSYLEWMET